MDFPLDSNLMCILGLLFCFPNEYKETQVIFQPTWITSDCKGKAIVDVCE